MLLWLVVGWRAGECEGGEMVDVLVVEVMDALRAGLEMGGGNSMVFVFGFVVCMWLEPGFW